MPPSRPEHVGGVGVRFRPLAHTPHVWRQWPLGTLSRGGTRYPMPTHWVLLMWLGTSTPSGECK